MNKSKGLFFIAVFAIATSIISLTAFAETKNTTVTAKKIEGNVLDKDGTGKISQFFDGNYLIVKQATFAIVWTEGEVSQNVKNAIVKKAESVDPSLKNSLKEPYIFVTDIKFSKAQNSNAKNEYCIVSDRDGYIFKVVSGGVSHIVYGKYTVSQEQPTVVPTSKPEVTPTNKPEVIPTNKPEVTPTDKPVNVPTNRPEVTPTNKPEVVPTNMPVVTPSNDPENVATDMSDAISTEIPSDSTVDSINNDALGNINRNGDVDGIDKEGEVLSINRELDDDTPKTGDNTNLVVFIIAIVISILGMSFVVIRKKVNS